MICYSDITNLKSDISENLGHKIIIRGSLGRNRSFEKEATLDKAYPSIFTVKYKDGTRNGTYSYTDILTRTVEVNVFNGDSYSPLIPPAPPEIHKKRELAEESENIEDIDNIEEENIDNII